MERERESGLIRILCLIFGEINTNLENVINFYNGFSFISSDNYNSSNYEGKIIKIGNIQKDGNLDLENVSTFNFNYYNQDLTPYKINKNNILLAMSGATLGKISFFQKDISNLFINQRVGKIEVIEEIAIPKFVYFYLNYTLPNWIEVNKIGSAQPNINTKDILKIKINIPSLKTQEKIVKVLDNFEAICKDLNIGLPAEEAKRQEQYEYYRDAIFKYLETGIIDNKGIGERERAD